MTSDQKEVLSSHLHTALLALQNKDENAYRVEIEALSDVGTREVASALLRLARELGDALGDLPSPDPDLAELTDASARLNHVVKVTESATHRTLDLLDECRQLSDGLAEMNLDPQAMVLVGKLRARLSEVGLAQSYQDITGQTIRGVARLVERVHAALAALGLATDAAREPTSGLSGPAVPGVDRHTVSQDDADDLMSGLGI